MKGSRDWQLAIRNVTEEDEGIYECQVNSLPRPASLGFWLQVSAPTISILQAPVANFEPGEQIVLTCLVDFGIEASPVSSKQSALAHDSLQTKFHYAYWYKENVSLEFNYPRAGIKIQSNQTDENYVKTLTIEDATTEDSGKYSCSILTINDLEPARVTVSVGGYIGPAPDRVAKLRASNSAASSTMNALVVAPLSTLLLALRQRHKTLLH